MENKLLEGLKKLDVKNDNHWTKEGLPKLEALTFAVGRPVSREDVEKLAPDFNRSNPVVAEVKNEDTSVQTEPSQVESNTSVKQEIKGNGTAHSADAPAQEKSTVVNLSVGFSFDDAVKALLGTYERVDLSTLSDEELANMRKEMEDTANSHNRLLSELNQLIYNNAQYHASVIEEQERRIPKSDLADALSSFRESMAGAQHAINNPRVIVRNGSRYR